MSNPKCEHTQEYLGDPEEREWDMFDNLPTPLVEDDKVIGLRFRCTRCHKSYKRMFAVHESTKGVYWKSIFNTESFVWEGQPSYEEDPNLREAYSEAFCRWANRVSKVFTNTYWKKRDYK